MSNSPFFGIKAFKIAQDNAEMYINRVLGPSQISRYTACFIFVTIGDLAVAKAILGLKKGSNNLILSIKLTIYPQNNAVTWNGCRILIVLTFCPILLHFVSIASWTPKMGFVRPKSVIHTNITYTVHEVSGNGCSSLLIHIAVLSSGIS